MLPKAINYLIKLDSISCIAANILKQEMLSLGADAALPRQALTAKVKKIECLLIGSSSQLNRLNEKLRLQSFGLDKLAQGLSRTLNNYSRNEFVINLGRYKLEFGKTTRIMGIVNLTPDSFSGDGLYKYQTKTKYQKLLSDIVEYVKCLVEDGADIIDLGGESSRPGAKAVSVEEELKRTIPVIKKLSQKIKVPLSIDTYKPEVAEQALDNGAVIVNDITGLRNPEMAKIVARHKAAVVIMHMKGKPSTMQKNPEYKSLMDEIISYLDKAINRAVAAGIDREKIIIDPGIGFGKTLEHNLEILKKLRELKTIGRPILIGASRKSFIGKILNLEPQERILGTLSSCVLAVQNGANILRVHDVKEVSQALKITDTILN
jgi:dihydropteroate synthase